jgi:hypothetical protein
MSVLHCPFDQLSVVLPLTAVCPSTTPATPAKTVRELRSLWSPHWRRNPLIFSASTAALNNVLQGMRGRDEGGLSVTAGWSVLIVAKPRHALTLGST